MDSNKEKKKICLKCKKLYENGRFCAIHPDEPLLDISNEEIFLFVKETLKNSILYKSKKFYNTMKVSVLIGYFCIFLCIYLFGKELLLKYTNFKSVSEFFIFIISLPIFYLIKCIEQFPEEGQSPAGIWALFGSSAKIVGGIFINLLFYVVCVSFVPICYKIIAIPAFKISKKIYPLIYKEPLIVNIEVFHIEVEGWEYNKEEEEYKLEDENKEKIKTTISFLTLIEYFFFADLISKYTTEKDISKIVNKKMNIFTKIIHYFFYYIVFYSWRRIKFFEIQTGEKSAKKTFEDYFNEIIGKK